jgi:amino acid transporter
MNFFLWLSGYGVAFPFFFTQYKMLTILVSFFENWEIENWGARCLIEIQNRPIGARLNFLNSQLSIINSSTVLWNRLLDDNFQFIFVLAGSVVRNTAGPGIVLSFIFAGIASFLSALCYAEFGARVPKAGSAYTYTYITVGEFWAFIIGWNIILEHMLGAAAVARSWSGYLDSLLGHVIKNATIANVGSMEVWFLRFFK